MSNTNDQVNQEKQDFQKQPQEPQPSPETKSPVNTLSKKKRLRLARLKRAKRLENKNSIDLNKLWNMIPSFSMIQYYFKSLFSIELRAFLLSLFFLLVLAFSSNLGLYLPSRYEVVSLNTTLKIGYFEDKTIFYPTFNFKKKHSQFSIYYQLKKRDDPFLTFDSEEKNTVGIIINISGLNMKTIIKKFNTTILKYSDVEVQPLCDITLDQPTNTLDIKIKFIASYSFSGFHSLAEISIQELVRLIGESAGPSFTSAVMHSIFSCCFSFKSTSILDSVRLIGHHAFAECTAMSS